MRDRGDERCRLGGNLSGMRLRADAAPRAYRRTEVLCGGVPSEDDGEGIDEARPSVLSDRRGDGRRRAGERRAVSGPQGPIEPELRAERPIDQNVRIGHVHLRTADIDRVRDF